MKQEINILRRERVIYDNVFKKLETDLKIKEEELMKYISETIEIENERDYILKELNDIKNCTD
jgi:hypothetical protein